MAFRAAPLSAMKTTDPISAHCFSWRLLIKSLLFFLISMVRWLSIYYVSLFFHVYTWTEGPATTNCDHAITRRSELTMEPEQPLSSAKFKREYGPIPAVRFSWCTAMLLSLTCLLRNGFGAAFMFFVIGPQAYT